MNHNNRTGIGILGGTFDPIHIGHLLIAEYLREELQLEKILFIPAKIHPLKENRSISDPQIRLEMVQLATRDNPNFQVSDIEIRSERVSYTVDTIAELRKTYPMDNYQLYFFLGIDNVNQLHKWKDPHRLMELCQLVAFNRPDFEPVPEAQSFLPHIRLVDIPLLEISSTEIRNRVRQGKSIRYWVPRQIEEFIHSQKLYYQRSI